jgi:hypothetical protein
LANENARALRKRLTPQEVKLWMKLRELKTLGFHFRRQAPIDRYIATSFRSDLDSLSKQMAVSTECRRAPGRIKFAMPFCSRRASEFFDSGIRTLMPISLG